jgi:hypothetical protein
MKNNPSVKMSSKNNAPAKHEVREFRNWITRYLTGLKDAGENYTHIIKNGSLHDLLQVLEVHLSLSEG